MAEIVEVTYAIDGTTKTDVFTGSWTSVQMFGDGGANVMLADGSDDQGRPVRDVLYRDAFRIVRRPTEGS
jgi:hypothetical protein